MTPAELPAELYRRRRALGLSQNRLRRLLGVGPQTISNWECGVYAPKNPKILDLALRWLEAQQEIGRTAEN